MLTLGSDQKDIDFEPEWRRRMQACQIPGRKTQKPKGRLCMLEAAIFVTCSSFKMQAIVCYTKRL